MISYLETKCILKAGVVAAKSCLFPVEVIVFPGQSFDAGETSKPFGGFGSSGSMGNDGASSGRNSTSSILSSVTDDFIDGAKTG